MIVSLVLDGRDTANAGRRNAQCLIDAASRGELVQVDGDFRLDRLQPGQASPIAGVLRLAGNGRLRIDSTFTAQGPLGIELHGVTIAARHAERTETLVTARPETGRILYAQIVGVTAERVRLVNSLSSECGDVSIRGLTVIDNSAPAFAHSSARFVSAMIEDVTASGISDRLFAFDAAGVDTDESEPGDLSGPIEMRRCVVTGGPPKTGSGQYYCALYAGGNTRTVYEHNRVAGLWWHRAPNGETSDLIARSQTVISRGNVQIDVFNSAWQRNYIFACKGGSAVCDGLRLTRIYEGNHYQITEDCFAAHDGMPEADWCLFQMPTNGSGSSGVVRTLHRSRFANNTIIVPRIRGRNSPQSFGNMDFFGNTIRTRAVSMQSGGALIHASSTDRGDIVMYGNTWPDIAGVTLYRGPGRNIIGAPDDAGLVFA